MILTDHQPAYLPWLGLFHKMILSDTFCLLDTVKYTKDFINRNRIKTVNGPIWLTVPVHAHGTLGRRICDVRVVRNGWQRKHLVGIEHSYSKAPYYDTYAEELAAILAREYFFLTELTTSVLRLLIRLLGIEVKLVAASDHDFTGKKSDLVLDMSRKLGASTYIFGAQGRNYADTAAFDAAGINVIFQEYRHPVYRQRFGAFIPGMSVLDLLFNEGPRARDILISGNLSREELLRASPPVPSRTPA